VCGVQGFVIHGYLLPEWFSQHKAPANRSGGSAERRKLEEHFLVGGFLPKAATTACGNFSKAMRGILVTT
jgi:hypothetical protein